MGRSSSDELGKAWPRLEQVFTQAKPNQDWIRLVSMVLKKLGQNGPDWTCWHRIVKYSWGLGFCWTQTCLD